jgi:class 3 adenylate cyclase
VNLFNLITLPTQERITVLHDVRRRTALVGRQHGAIITELPNAGVLLTFTQADDDQCFKVLCAALLLAEMLDEMNELRHAAERVELKFRFGVHTSTCDNDGTAAPHPDAVADALMLSAVAPEGTIATSREAFEQLSRPERFVVEELANPLLKTLTTSVHDQCVIVSAAADAYGAALDRQGELLRAQADSISTPSTF